MVAPDTAATSVGLQSARTTLRELIDSIAQVRIQEFPTLGPLDESILDKLLAESQLLCQSLERRRSLGPLFCMLPFDLLHELFGHLLGSAADYRKLCLLSRAWRLELAWARDSDEVWKRFAMARFPLIPQLLHVNPTVHDAHFARPKGKSYRWIFDEYAKLEAQLPHPLDDYLPKEVRWVTTPNRTPRPTQRSDLSLSVHLYHNDKLVATAVSTLAEALWRPQMVWLDLWGPDAIQTRQSPHPAQDPPERIAHIGRGAECDVEAIYGLRAVIYVNKAWAAYRVFDAKAQSIEHYDPDEDEGTDAGWEIHYPRILVPAADRLGSYVYRRGDIAFDVSLHLPYGNICLFFTRQEGRDTRNSGAAGETRDEYGEAASDEEIVWFFEDLCGQFEGTLERGALRSRHPPGRVHP